MDFLFWIEPFFEKPVFIFLILTKYMRLEYDTDIVIIGDQMLQEKDSWFSVFQDFLDFSKDIF